MGNDVRFLQVSYSESTVRLISRIQRDNHAHHPKQI